MRQAPTTICEYSGNEKVIDNCINKMFVYLHYMFLGTSVGAKDLPWCDCKILDKFHEKNVFWTHIECRSFYCLIVPFFTACLVLCNIDLHVML